MMYMILIKSELNNGIFNVEVVLSAQTQCNKCTMYNVSQTYTVNPSLLPHYPPTIDFILLDQLLKTFLTILQPIRLSLIVHVFSLSLTLPEAKAYIRELDHGRICNNEWTNFVQRSRFNFPPPFFPLARCYRLGYYCEEHL